MKKILVVDAHPKADSYCNALTDKYILGAVEAGNDVERIDLRELPLEEFVKHEHQETPDLPEQLLEAQRLVTWAEHLVFVYPTWWATPPALLKVFFEMVFHSGFAFKYKKSTGIAPKWDRLLPNKSASIISTMDSPPWYYKWLVGDPGYKMMKDIMNFCGIKPVRRQYYGSVKMSTDKQRATWLKEVYDSARSGSL